MTDQPTTLDQLAVVKMLAKPTAMGLVIVANPHLTKARVEAIAADAGYPKINDLRQALIRLQRQADDERMASGIHTGPTDASVQRGTRTMDHAPAKAVSKQAGSPVLAPSARPAQVAQGPRPYEPTAQLLLEARDSTQRRTVALAKKIEDLLVDLRDRLRAEAQAAREASMAAARKVREAQEREREREAALADVAKAEEALRAAREKARRFKNTPGGNGRPKVLRSQSSESRQPGGQAVSSVLKDRHAHQRDFLNRYGITAAHIRAWGQSNGHQVGKNGLLARALLDAYAAAHTTKAAS